ncbi:MAG TPA: tetratricopeptide repeat protein [bacterium (Candidatus Stahlbacteria)]|nr:tetratricopeptide repeat protein [Candidatus Stahlbacteria bacterium]
MIATLMIIWTLTYLTPKYIDSIFVSANNLYQQGAYQEALDRYTTLSVNGIEHSALYYNIGNCYYKLGKIGKAILFYKRAKKLNPWDKDIEFNLNFARSNRIDQLKELRKPKFVELILRFIHKIGPNLSLLSASAIYFLIFIILTISLFFKKQIFRHINLVLLVALIFFIVLASVNIRRINQREGVLLKQEGNVRSGPSPDYTLIFTVHEGMEFRILEQREDWARILLPNGMEGWLKIEGIGEI